MHAICNCRSYEWTAPSEFCPTNGAETYNPRDDGYCYGDQLQPTPRPPGAYIPEAERPPTPVKQVHGVCMHRNLCVDTQEWTIDEETEVSLPGCANAATVCCVPPMPFTCKAASGPAFCEPYTPKVALHPRLDVLPQTVETGDDCRDYVGPLPTASRDPPPGVAIRTDADSAAPALPSARPGRRSSRGATGARPRRAGRPARARSECGLLYPCAFPFRFSLTLV